MFEQQEELKDFLDVLFPYIGKDELLEVRLIHVDRNSGIKPITHFYSTKDEVLFAFPKLLKMQSKGYGIFIGVCPRKRQTENKKQTGTIEDVSRAHVLWADIDAKDFGGNKQKVLEQLLTFKPEPTMIVDSGYGYHPYWSIDPSQIDLELVKSYLKAICSELSADTAVSEVSRVMRMPGSFNNKEAANPIPVKVHYIEDYNYDLMFFDFLQIQEKVTESEAKDPNWIAQAINELKEGNRHETFKSIIGRFIRDKHTPEAVFTLLKAHAEESFHAELEQEINDMFKRYSKPSVSSSDVSVNEYSAYFDGLIDIVEDENGNPAFLIKENGQLTIHSEWTVEGGRVLPPPKETLPWLLARAKEVLRYYVSDTDKQLYFDLLAYHKNISELPSEEYYDLLVTWVFHTYLLENFSYSPFIYFFAITERGKSRTGRGMVYVSYRGYCTDSINEPQLVRLANNCGISLFIDVTDLWKVAKDKSIQDLLLNRFEKGSKVARVLNPELGAFRDTTYFKVFGPTIIATNVKVSEILESRAVEINMPETDKLFENEVKEIDALSLRERLVAFRGRHLGDKMPDVAKPVKARLGDIIKPLLQVVHFINPERVESFMNLIEIIETGRKIERSESKEAKLLKALIASEHSVHRGRLETQYVVDFINKDRLQRYHTTASLVGKDLVAMGFEKKNATNGNAAIIYDQEKIARLMTRYGISKISESSEFSEFSESEANNNG